LVDLLLERPAAGDDHGVHDVLVAFAWEHTANEVQELRRKQRVAMPKGRRSAVATASKLTLKSFLLSTGSASAPASQTARAVGSFVIASGKVPASTSSPRATRARTQDPEHLGEGPALARGEIQDAVRHDSVERPVRERERLHEALAKLDVVGAGLGDMAAGAVEHRWSHVEADDAPGRSDGATDLNRPGDDGEVARRPRRLLAGRDRG